MKKAVIIRYLYFTRLAKKPLIHWFIRAWSPFSAIGAAHASLSNVIIVLIIPTYNISAFNYESTLCRKEFLSADIFCVLGGHVCHRNDIHCRSYFKSLQNKATAQPYELCRHFVSFAQFRCEWFDIKTSKILILVHLRRQ